jgi:putative ABC transport system ATP-binding protein
MSEAHIHVTNLHKSYANGTTPALQGIELEVAASEFLSICGPDGSGKTTLMMILAGMLAPDMGQIYINGVSLNTIHDLAQYRRRFIGVISAKARLVSHLTLLENVMLPMLPIKLSYAKKRDKAAALLHSIGQEGSMFEMPTRLSHVERHRLAIVQALANSPEILIADEPTGDLNSSDSQTIMTMLQAVHAHTKATMLLLTHSTQISEYAERTVGICDGSIIS